MDEYESLLTNNRIWKKRTVGIGVLSPRRSDRLGHHRTAAARLGRRVGSAPRAAVRVLSRSSTFDIPIGKNGDTYDRYLVRMAEMRQSNSHPQAVHPARSSRPRPATSRPRSRK